MPAATPGSPLTDAELARVDEVHRALGDSLPWADGNRPGAHASAAVTVLRHADLEGLRPADYAVTEIEDRWTTRSGLARLLTGALLRYLEDARLGRVDAGKRSVRIPAAEATRLLRAYLDDRNPVPWLLGQSPQHRHYRQLKHALARYRDIDAAGGFPALGAGPTIRPGDSDPRVSVLRERLRVEGYEFGASVEPDTYDESLQAAIIAFQRRRGLQPDGFVGGSTLRELDIASAALVSRIELAMERWRRDNRDFGHRYVLVNVPAYTLEAVAGDAVTLEMPVIVGEPRFGTPDIDSEIRQIEVNPYWNVPTSIVVNEFLPELLGDPLWLRSNHHRLFAVRDERRVEIDSSTIDWEQVGTGIARYRVRQDPGPWNALGALKFVLPNNHDIYLHDTPYPSLFGLAARALSHGCIRLSKPWELAAFALDTHVDSGWFQRIREQAASGKNARINLPSALPVHLVYRTAWVDSAGEIRFNSDVYGRDNDLRRRLFGS